MFGFFDKRKNLENKIKKFVVKAEVTIKGDKKGKEKLFFVLNEIDNISKTDKMLKELNEKYKNPKQYKKCILKLVEDKVKALK